MASAAVAALLLASAADAAQPDVGQGDLLEGIPVEISGLVYPQAPPAAIALAVLVHASPGTGLESLTFHDWWTVRVRNTYACTTGIPGECRTFATAHFLVDDRPPHRIFGFGLP